MSNLLAIDAGNTNVKYGLFSHGKIAEFWTHELSAADSTFEASLARYDVPIALASVAPTATAAIKQICAKQNRAIFSINASTQSFLSGMNETMGADRVADAVGAWKLYGKGERPVILMGFGTATTLLAISAEGHVVGGWIAPGVSSMLEALHARCQLLPLLEMKGQSEVLGYDTESHMRNGVFLAHIGLVKQWLHSARKGLQAAGERKDAVTVATGGSANVAHDFEPLFDFVAKELTLNGVYLIAEAAGVPCAATGTGV